MIPRIRGKVGQCYEDKEKPNNVGKWFFTLWLSFLGEGEGDEVGTWGPFESESVAKTEMEKIARIVCDGLAEQMPGGIPGKYIDMKDNKVKHWVEK